LAQESILSKTHGQTILEIEKDIVKYSNINQEETLIVLTNKRLILKINGRNINIPLGNIRKLERGPKGVCYCDDNKTILIDYYFKGNRVRSVIIIDFFRDDFFLLLMRSIIGTCEIFLQYPSFLGGIIKTDSKWAKGSLKINEKNFYIKTMKKEFLFYFDDVVDFGQNLYLKDSSGKTILSLLVLQGEEEIGFNIYTDSNLIPFIELYLSTVGQNETDKMRLDEMTNQLLFLLYTGYKNEGEIMEIMGIPKEELDKLYDQLIDRKIVRLVEIKRVVELTNPTIKYVNSIVKRGFG
jgi:helix-turn-helix protein